jgi:hypothetical protein
MKAYKRSGSGDTPQMSWQLKGWDKSDPARSAQQTKERDRNQSRSFVKEAARWLVRSVTRQAVSLFGELAWGALTASGAVAIRVRLCLVAYIALAGCFFLARKLWILPYFCDDADHFSLNTVEHSTLLEALLLAGRYGLRGCQWQGKARKGDHQRCRYGDEFSQWMILPRCVLSGLAAAFLNAGYPASVN